MGSGITRLCDGDVKWLLQYGAGWGCGNSGTGVCWQTVEDGWWISSTACVEICRRWAHWQRGVAWLGSLGIYLTARKPPWDGSRMGWDGGRFYQECLPSPPVGWIRLNVLGVVGQRKLFSVVTGKRNMSKVSPGLGWCQSSTSGICLTTVNDSMVVRKSNSHSWSPGSNPWRSQIYSVLSQWNWHVERMRSGITRLCNGEVSWFLQNGGGWGCGNNGTSVCCQTVENAWVVNLFYCLAIR